MSSRRYDGSCGESHSSYDDYDHSDEELYVYDQCCQDCRYCGDMGAGDDGCRKLGREDYEPFPKSNWCMDWKGKGGCR